MITANVKAKANEIIEAASELVDFVVLSIIDDPAIGDPARTHVLNTDWQDRYEAIKDLNVITPPVIKVLNLIRILMNFLS